MSDIPGSLHYIASHQWVRLDKDGLAVVGITDFAQASLGDVVYVELPDVGARVSEGGEAGVVESVKSASDVYSPVSGEVVAINEALADAPEQVNEDPYGEGWMFKVRLDEGVTLDDFELLDANGYAAAVQADA
ncbi:MAG: glycine cleavage system protein GcvH [Gammaproteobacteria bacterium]|nr:glycine cleavage system protein GcvH [Gammaproteobacteria bacterium]